MRRTYLIILIIIMLTAGACSKFLDIVPKDKFIPVSVTDYENMLNSATMVNYGDYFQDLMSDDAFLPQDDPGNLYVPLSLSARRIYTFNPDVHERGDLDPLWSESYKRIFYDNTIINNIMDATEGSLETKKSVRAEAYLGRAMEFLSLVNVYAQHYDSATAATQPGIPLALIADISAKFERNTVQEVYDQVLTDAKAATLDLPLAHKLTKFRASKAGGYALQSRVYLFTGDYTNAKLYADSSIQLQGDLADMNDYKITIPGPFPNVPGAPLGWTDIPDGQYNVETIVARHFLRPFGLGMSVCASPELSALFTDNDRRWTLYYANGWPPAPPYNYMSRYNVRIFLRGDYYSNYCDYV